MATTSRLPLISTSTFSLFVKSRCGWGWHRLASPGPGPPFHLEIPITCTPTSCLCRQGPQKNWFWLETASSYSKESPLLALSARAVRTLTPYSFPSKCMEKQTRPNMLFVLIIKLTVSFNSCLSIPSKPACFQATVVNKITVRSV